MAIIKTAKKRLQFHIMREKFELESIMPELPENEVFKLISNGGFSSIGFIKVLADKAVINQLSASTLRIGKKHLAVLDNLHTQNRLKNARFIVGSIMKNDSDYGKKFGYYDNLEEICNKNGWQIGVLNNHSKILLFDTDAGKYVLETSSNLNENPNIEQFSFEKNAELYDFYNELFDEWLREVKR